MGVLIEVASDDFLLQKEDFDAALEALKKLGKKKPYDIALPEQLAAAKTLPEALEAAGMYVRLDGEGDLVGIGSDDKAPSNSGSHWPHSIIVVIAKFVRRADIHGFVEDGAEPQWWLIEGGKLKNYDFVHRERLEALPVPGPVARGEQVAFDVRLKCLWGDPVALPPLTLSHTDGLEVEKTKLEAGLRFSVRVRSEAAGRQCVSLNGELPSHYLSLDVPIAVVAEVEANEGAKIVEHRTSLGQGRGVFMRSAEFERALREMKRYAARHANEPGGSFLKQVEAATDAIQALGATGLGPELDAKGNLKRFVPEASTLVGHDRFITGLFGSFVHRTKNEGSLGLAFEHAPKRWVEWSWRYRSVERVESPR